MQQPLYGLIGGKLGHSYSKLIHEQIADYTYDLLPLPTEAEARVFMEKRAFTAINVTIPYKQFVIPYCDEVDPKAKAIGAVNTIVNRDRRLYGYNTDYAGFSYLAKAHGVDFADKTVLILGTGGTHSTVAAVCRDGGAREILTASRTGRDGALLYSEAMHRRDVQIIINTTPCGMYPNVGQCLIDPKAFPRLEAVLDVVYNPFRTELLLRAEDCGVTAAGGFEMLVAQAVFAAEHFTGSTLDTDTLIPTISRRLRHQLANVSLIGMPGCGKSTVGAALAKRLDKRFVDLDAEIERRTGHNIPDIFAEEGEEAFRRYEAEVLAEVAKGNSQVIACGGGGVPVVRDSHGDYYGVDAVIDKDFASAKLAELLDADMLVILTAVEKVAINFGKPDQKGLDTLTPDEARKYIDEKQFAPGSMLPKVQAAMSFAESKPGRVALITLLEKAAEGIEGKTGTRVQM